MSSSRSLVESDFVSPVPFTLAYCTTQLSETRRSPANYMLGIEHNSQLQLLTMQGLCGLGSVLGVLERDKTK